MHKYSGAARATPAATLGARYLLTLPRSVPADQSLGSFLVIIPLSIVCLCVLLVIKSILESFFEAGLDYPSVHTFRIPIALVIFLLDSATKILTQLLATLFARYLLTLPPNGVGNDSAISEVLPIAVLSLSFFFLAKAAIFGIPQAPKDHQA